VSKVCGEDKWGASSTASSSAVTGMRLVGIVGMQRRRNGLLDRGQADHYDRLGLVERGCALSFRLSVESCGKLMRELLVNCRAHQADKMDEIHNSAT